MTVSSQLPNPISTQARVLDVFLQEYAISVVAILAGAFGAFFHRRGMERDPPQSLRQRPRKDPNRELLHCRFCAFEVRSTAHSIWTRILH